MIRNALVAFLLLPLALLFAQTTGNTPVEKARQAVDLLLQGKYAEILALSSAEMKKALPEEKFRAGAEPVLRQVGAVRKRLEPKTQAVGENQVVVLPIEFEHASLDFIVSFNKAGEIAGFFYAAIGPGRGAVESTALQQAAVVPRRTDNHRQG